MHPIFAVLTTLLFSGPAFAEPETPEVAEEIVVNTVEEGTSEEGPSLIESFDQKLGQYVVGPLASFMFWDVMFWDNSIERSAANGLLGSGSFDDEGEFKLENLTTQIQANELAAAGQLSATWVVTEVSETQLTLHNTNNFRTHMLRPAPRDAIAVTTESGVELSVIERDGLLEATIQTGNVEAANFDLGDSPVGIPGSVPLDEWLLDNAGVLALEDNISTEGLVVTSHIASFPVVLRDGNGPWEIIPASFEMTDALWHELIPIESGSHVRAGDMEGVAQTKNDNSDSWLVQSHDAVTWDGPITNPENRQFPLVVIWLVLGAVYFTLRMQFINLRGFTHAVEVLKGDYDHPEDEGEISHFQALSAALSATVGLGNIAGVAIAVGLGGPGAVFWMVMAGFLGMSSKFTECSLGQMYRTVDSNGNVLGGPMRYLHAGLADLGRPKLGRALAIIFAVMCIGGSLGGGNMFQANQSAAAVGKVVPLIGGERVEAMVVLNRDTSGTMIAGLDSINVPKDTNLSVADVNGNSITFRTTEAAIIPANSESSGPIPVLSTDGGHVILDGDASWSISRIAGVSTGSTSEGASVDAGTDNRLWLYGVILMGFVGLVILGGIKRIGAAAGKIVPAMCGIYILAGAWILLANASAVGPAFMQIISEAFTPAAVGYGGLIGVLVQGFKRAAFSNEAGTGSASIAHSAAATSEPIREGLVSLLEPFIDTLIVCTMTGLVVVITGTYLTHAGDGVLMTSAAFESVLPWFPLVLSLAVMLFAFSTMISWSYYGERCATYLFGPKASTPYKLLFLACVFIGTVLPLGNVLDFSDLMILGMAFPNIFGLVLLSTMVKKALDKYWTSLKAGEFKKAEA